ncbi:hypothetical protein [Legionella sp.]|uniref:hypothetical protein n=1 Tax=Legionella sp. TaxID=459 RepID=UPI003CAFCFCA
MSKFVWIVQGLANSPHIDAVCGKSYGNQRLECAANTHPYQSALYFKKWSGSKAIA